MLKTSARLQAVKEDVVLEAVADVVRADAEAVAHPRPVNEHIGLEMVPERLATYYFVSTSVGYMGWCWAVIVARVPCGRVATVYEAGMTPREGVLLALVWVSWEDHLRLSDISRDDVLPYKTDDGRLVQSFEDTSMDPDLPVVREPGLGRVHVLSPEGYSQAAKRWYELGRGPKFGCRPRSTRPMCGFLVKMGDNMRTMLGVCANEWATDDGAAVSFDHTCDSHSEADVPKNDTAWPVRLSHVNEGALDAELMPRASNGAKKDEAAAAEVTPAQAEALTGEEPED